jgi:polysaccharide deacetylase family protein (PEP-CTERM system associated)
MLNALTFDVEEHFQVHAFAKVVNRTEWDHYSSRVIPNTNRILELLAKHNVFATFFILGWVADRYPDLVRMIASGGHEIGTHGYWHQLVYQQSPSEFAEDIKQSIEAIGRAVKNLPPMGYRAPSFSITDNSLWALDVLKEQGIVYDSSVFPVGIHHRYGIKTANRFANQLPNGLWEFPLSTIHFANQYWPATGGGYFRLYPLWLTRRIFRSVHAEGNPVVLYLHPWEFDPAPPSVGRLLKSPRFRHYVNIDKTETRLDALLQQFPFAPMQEVFSQQLGSYAKAPLSVATMPSLRPVG